MLLNLFGRKVITLCQSWWQQQRNVSVTWGEVKFLWQYHYIWQSGEGGDTWREGAWLGGEGGWVNGEQVGESDNEQVHFHHSSGIPQRKSHFKVQSTNNSSTELNSNYRSVVWRFRSEVTSVRSPIPVQHPDITRPVCIPLTTTKTCMTTMKILQHHDSQHIVVIVPSEPLRKPVWKLQAGMYAWMLIGNLI